MATLYKYRILCTTDSKYEYVWSEDPNTGPTTCPTNTGHTVDSTSVAIVQTMQEAYSANSSEYLKAEIHKPEEDSAIIVTPNFGDPCTWYGDSVSITDEVLTDSGDGLTFNSAHVNWIDVTHGRLTNEEDIAADYPVVIKINDVAATPEENAYATAIHDSVTFTAARIGPRGNSISLTFDGTSDTLDSVVNAWNSSNYHNKVSHDGVGATVPAAGTVNLKAGDYTVNYENGDVTFYQSQSGNTIKASYYYEDGSTYYLRPDASKILEITRSEVQFSNNIELYDIFDFEVWVYNPNDLPNKMMYQRESYKNMKDFINTANLGSGEITATSELTTNLLVFPYDYTGLKILKSSQGAEIRLKLREDIKVSAELGTATFYVSIRDE